MFSHLTCCIWKIKGASEKTALYLSFSARRLSPFTVLYSLHSERSRRDNSQLMQLYKVEDFTCSCVFKTHIGPAFNFENIHILNRSCATTIATEDRHQTAGHEIKISSNDYHLNVLRSPWHRGKICIMPLFQNRSKAFQYNMLIVVALLLFY